MDENITTEALTRLAQVHTDAVQPSVFAQLGDGLQAVWEFFTAHPAYLFSGGLLISLCVLCIFACLHGEKRSLWSALGAASCLMLALALVTYLSMKGRLLSRAVDCALFPAVALLSGLALCRVSFSRVRPPYRVVAALLCVFCVGLSAGNVLSMRRVLAARPDTLSPTRQAQLEAYGLERSDMLILYDSNLLRDTRLFPDVSGGIPKNLMIWGDWYCRTPSWYSQLSAFGINGPAFTAKDFFRSNLLYVTAEDEPPAQLIAYLSEPGGPAVWQAYDTYGDLRFFQFTLQEGI